MHNRFAALARAQPQGFESLRPVESVGAGGGSPPSVPVGVWQAATRGATAIRATRSSRRESIIRHSGEGSGRDNADCSRPRHHGGQSPDTMGNDFFHPINPVFSIDA